MVRRYRVQTATKGARLLALGAGCAFAPAGRTHRLFLALARGPANPLGHALVPQVIVGGLIAHHERREKSRLLECFCASTL